MLEVRADGDPVVMGDRAALEAAFDAVLENVARHGGGAATVALGTRGGTVRVLVADRGTGLPAERRAAVFERFVRADPSRSRDRGGAGLGLALARELVRTQGGRIWLEETPGGGLTAVIELPAATDGVAGRSAG